MSNLLKVIKFTIDNPITEIKEQSISTNRINAVGQSLECYIQRVFCESMINSVNYNQSLLNNSPFSYIGNQNNPPDLMLKNGDAIEIKKIQTANANLALNSSYPKDKLYANNPMITNNCKTVEDWVEKDLLYVVGHIEATTIKYL